MNQDHLSQLLERAAASVTPTVVHPGPELAERGRRGLQRRRRMTGGGLVTAAVAVAALAGGVGDRSGSSGPTLDDGSVAASGGQTVRHGDVSVVVPQGWQVRRTDVFEPCSAQQDTLYLTKTWAPVGPSARRAACPQGRGTFMAVVTAGVAPFVNPPLLTMRGGRLVQAGDDRLGSVTSYRPFTGEISATTVFASGDEATQRRLLENVTFPSVARDGGAGGLAVPARLTNVLSTAKVTNGMVNASDARTVESIRSQLAALRDPAPADQMCDLTDQNSVGFALSDANDSGGVTVVIGDASCPYAVSTKGGPVHVPAGLGEQLRALVVESDRVTSGG